MKPVLGGLYSFFSSVLNPHGSDETVMSQILFFILAPVLNPHGSDETNLVVWDCDI